MAGTKHNGCNTTIMTDYSTYFLGAVNEERIFKNEPMDKHSSFRTGGCADVLLVPDTEAELLAAMAVIRAHSLPFFVIGRGSNLLVADAGVRGVVVKIAYGSVSVVGNTIIADAGVSLRQVALAAANAGLGGLEFAAGIPGSLGGGLAMNAGAYGGELGSYIQCVRVLDSTGEVQELSRQQLHFSYRHSAILEHAYIVLSAVFQLPEGNKAESLALIDELAAKRKEKQPLEHPSAGSTFKRPPGQFAGALIEQCGLKGASCCGAQVSPKHAGFIVNTGGAKSSDIYQLMCKVQETVYREKHIRLEAEVQLLGEFPDD